MRNGFIQAGLSLEKARAEMGKHLDIPYEERAETWDGELTTLKAAVEARQAEYQAAGLLEPPTEETTMRGQVDAEMRERLELRSRASLGRYFTAALAGRMPTGAEAELNAAAGIDGGIPLELWDTAQRLEERATADAPGTVGVNLDMIRPAVFANAILPRLGVDMPRVDSGTYASATISTSQNAAALAKGGAAAGVTGAFSVTTATPKRVSARLELAIEDIAAVGADNFEAALRENASLALSAELDNQGLNGNGTAPNLAGLFQRLTDPTAAPDAATNFDAFAAAHAGGVDGLWATGINEVGIVAGAATYRRAASTFQTATNYKGEMSAAAYAKMNTGGFWTNARMPAPATFLTVDNIQMAVLYRMGRSFMNMGNGYTRTAVCPHWNMIAIDDIYSGSASGERYFTIHALLGDVIVVQPDAYEQIAYRTA